MKQNTFITQPPKKSDKVIILGVDLAHLPSNTHKYGAIKNKSQVFEDRRFKKPKYKKNYLDD